MTYQEELQNVTTEIQTATLEIEKLQKRVEFLKAFKFLFELQETAITPIPDYMQQYHDGKTEEKTFSYCRLTEYQTVSRRVKNVQSAIETYEIRNDIKPDWADEALINAEIVDKYSEDI